MSLQAVGLDRDGLGAGELPVDGHLHEVVPGRHHGPPEPTASASTATPTAALRTFRTLCTARTPRTLRTLSSLCALRSLRLQRPAHPVQAGGFRRVERAHDAAGDVGDLDLHVARIALQPIADQRARIGVDAAEVL